MSLAQITLSKLSLHLSGRERLIIVKENAGQLTMNFAPRPHSRRCTRGRHEFHGNSASLGTEKSPRDVIISLSMNLTTVTV